jgi:non-specific serine/threonine protein kinase
MERLEGQTLKHRIQGKPLKVEEVLELAIQSVDPLEAADEKGIVNRDIKRANIFVVERGQAKILDFGLPKLAPKRKRAAEAVGASALPTATAGRTPDQPGCSDGHCRLHVTGARRWRVIGWHQEQ